MMRSGGPSRSTVTNPVTGTPDLRAAWHEALAALGTVDAPDVRGMPDGMLLHLRDTYHVETAWAPPWTGDELRQARTRSMGSPRRPPSLLRSPGGVIIRGRAR
jgi:hypothetical protein